MRSESLPPVLGISEVMRLLASRGVPCGQQTVLRLARAGAFVGRKLGDGQTATWAFTGESVQAYLDKLDSDNSAAS